MSVGFWILFNFALFSRFAGWLLVFLLSPFAPAVAFRRAKDDYDPGAGFARIWEL